MKWIIMFVYSFIHVCLFFILFLFFTNKQNLKLVKLLKYQFLRVVTNLLCLTLFVWFFLVHVCLFGFSSCLFTFICCQFINAIKGQKESEKNQTTKWNEACVCQRIKAFHHHQWQNNQSGNFCFFFKKKRKRNEYVCFVLSFLSFFLSFFLSVYCKKWPKNAKLLYNPNDYHQIYI